MHEGAPSTPNKKRSNIFEAAALSVGLLAAAHPEAKALEIDPYTPWHIAVQDNIRQAIDKDVTEYSAVYVQFTDRSGEWIPVTKGELRTVSKVDTESDVANVRIQTRQREIASVCHIHTHQKEFLRQTYGPDGPKLYNPPSPNDIMYSYHTRYLYQQNQIDPGKIQFAVAEGHGFWHFGPTVGAMAGKITAPGSAEESKLSNEVISFRERSGNKDFNFSVELPKLKEAYKKIGGEIRFASFKQMLTEPPCVGVNYKAPK